MERGEYIFVADDHYIPSEFLSIPKRYVGFVDKILVNNGLIVDRIHKLAQEINQIYAGQHLVILVLLKGAFRFAKDLTNSIDGFENSVTYNLEFVRVKSYENDVQHEIKIQGLENINLEGKHVLVVEDLVDSGNSLTKVKEILSGKGLANLRVSVLFFKRNPINTLIVPELIGFSIPDEWIVGYGMDYNEAFRDFNHVGVLNEIGKEHYRIR